VVSRAVRDADAEAEFLGLHQERRRLELRTARLLARIARARHFVFRGCSSIAQYGELHGLSAREAWTLCAVGKVLDFEPKVESRILEGALSLESAAALLKLYENPALVREGEDWLARAVAWTTRELERAIRERLVEAETGESASVLTAVLSLSGRVKFERARQLACRKSKELLSEGKTIEVLSDHYLVSFDPERKRPRSRRVPHTATHAGRHVPSSVKRAVRARQGDRCAVPGCDHRIWIEHAHVVPHRRGGSREADNLVYLCRQHHVLFDEGVLEILGTAKRPRFRVRDQGAASGSTRGRGQAARSPPP